MTQEFQRLSYSQFGEDGVLAWLFPGRTHGFYIDVGCHHPFRFSNTALLHVQHGWSGINIDVDERAIEAFRRLRPDDTNILAGVANFEGEMEVTIFEEGAINSFDRSSSDHPAWSHIPRTRHMVHVCPLAKLLQEHLKSGQHVDYMNIDAEGLDYDVLTSNDWHLNTPDVISVETHDLDLQDLDASRAFVLLKEKGYRLISHVALTSIYKISA